MTRCLGGGDVRAGRCPAGKMSVSLTATPAEIGLYIIANYTTSVARYSCYGLYAVGLY